MSGLACFEPEAQGSTGVGGFCEDTPINTEPPSQLTCPDTQPGELPAGWKDYPGGVIGSEIFHCGYDGIVEDRVASPESPINECFYDESGNLVTDGHPYEGCQGTPDQYDASTNKWDHTFNDTGGIVQSGPGAATESMKKFMIESLLPGILVGPSVVNLFQK